MARARTADHGNGDPAPEDPATAGHPPPRARVTLQTVADHVGVSRMTVSNAFSRPDQLSAGLRERILQAAEELGYAGPDPAARALARGSTGAVGLVVAHSIQSALADEVSTRFLAAIAAELEPTGLALSLVPTAEAGGHVPAREVAIDGALVFHGSARSPALKWLRRRRIPVVLVDQDPLDGLPAVTVDDVGGAQAAAEHLVALGHRHVGLVAFGGRDTLGRTEPEPLPEDSFGTRERIRGWLQGLRSLSQSPAVVRTANTVEGGYQVLDDLLRADPRTTAVLCWSDVIAAGIQLAAQDRGLEVPDDLSIVGFDDSPLALRLRPALTTVRQDVEEKGRLATAALIAALSPAGDPVETEHVRLPTELVVRESTAAPRSAR